MDVTLFATKGNLITAKNTLRLSRQGYELMDKKRTILINEMMGLIKVAEEIQSQIDSTFTEAYKALQLANLTSGISRVYDIAQTIDVKDDVSIRMRSIMGVDIPEVLFKKEKLQPAFGFFNTDNALDRAYQQFDKVRTLTVHLAGVENAVYRLALNIKKTSKRANALQSIIIPRYEGIVKNIQNVLEEKDREEFTRLKVIKSKKRT